MPGKKQRIQKEESPVETYFTVNFKLTGPSWSSEYAAVATLQWLIRFYITICMVIVYMR